MEIANEYSSALPNGVVLPGGCIAWKSKDIPRIIEVVRNNRWVILGGDVVTEDGAHTYDNWFYEPDDSQPLEHNVECSINICMSYVSRFVSLFGSHFLFELIVSRNYKPTTN